MVAPTPQQIKSLTAIFQQGHWNSLNEYLDAEVQDAMKVLLANTDTAKVHEMRGWIKAIQHLQLTVRTAPETMKKLGLTPTL